MKCKRITLTILVLFLFINLFSQRIEYSYDANGNRTNRTLVVEQLRSQNANFPPSDTLNQASLIPEAVAGGPTEEKMELNSDIGEISATIFPNPTRGILKIDIRNMPLNSRNELRLYDLSGNELLVKKDFESYSEFDVSNCRDGVYILRIKINDQIFDWKVIKSNY